MENCYNYKYKECFRSNFTKLKIKKNINNTNQTIPSLLEIYWQKKNQVEKENLWSYFGNNGADIHNIIFIYIYIISFPFIFILLATGWWPISQVQFLWECCLQRVLCRCKTIYEKISTWLEKWSDTLWFGNYYHRFI